MPIDRMKPAMPASVSVTGISLKIAKVDGRVDQQREDRRAAPGSAVIEDHEERDDAEADRRRRSGSGGSSPGRASGRPCGSGRLSSGTDSAPALSWMTRSVDLRRGHALDDALRRRSAPSMRGEEITCLSSTIDIGCPICCWCIRKSGSPASPCSSKPTTGFIASLCRWRLGVLEIGAADDRLVDGPSWGRRGGRRPAGGVSDAGGRRAGSGRFWRTRPGVAAIVHRCGLRRCRGVVLTTVPWARYCPLRIDDLEQRGFLQDLDAPGDPQCRAARR